jgi:ketosteroid isomerase-like protein
MAAVDEERLQIVRRMWIDFREQGVDEALVHLHPDVEFQLDDGTVLVGHQGVRDFFSQFDGDRQFAAAPYTFEPCGEGVIVAGHRRIHSPGSSDAEYTYFSHHVREGMITRIAAWADREAATADLTG